MMMNSVCCCCAEGDQQRRRGRVPDGSRADLKQPVNVHFWGTEKKVYKAVFHAANSCVTRFNKTELEQLWSKILNCAH